MQQILTSEIGEKWIQPSLVPDNNCSRCNRSLEIEQGLYCFPKNAMVKPEGYCKKFEEKPCPEPEKTRSHPESEAAKSKPNSGAPICQNCKSFCDDRVCFLTCKKTKKDATCEQFDPYLIHCIEVVHGDTVRVWRELTGNWQYGKIAEIDEWGIVLESKTLLRHGDYEKVNHSPETPSKICGPCSDCNSFDTSIPDDSIWKFCLSKGKYLPQNDLGGCEDFKPIIPYQSPSKSRRTRGDGSGCIFAYPTVQNGKTYEQYYYHYEIRENGHRIAKSSRYIPKKKLETIQSMEEANEPVTKILYELGLII